MERGREGAEGNRGKGREKGRGEGGSIKRRGGVGSGELEEKEDQRGRDIVSWKNVIKEGGKKELEKRDGRQRGKRVREKKEGDRG